MADLVVIFASYSLQKQCDYEDVLNIFDEVRRVLEEPVDGNEMVFNSFLLPPEDEYLSNDAMDENDRIEHKKLRMLLNETRNIMERYHDNS
jgi:hypothetical protein